MPKKDDRRGWASLKDAFDADLQDKKKQQERQRLHDTWIKNGLHLEWEASFHGRMSAFVDAHKLRTGDLVEMTMQDKTVGAVYTKQVGTNASCIFHFYINGSVVGMGADTTAVLKRVLNRARKVKQL